MDSFVWCLAVILGIDVVWRIVQLGTGIISQRTRGEIAIDALFNTAIFTWAVYLLAH